jgi:hypothetical protein
MFPPRLAPRRALEGACLTALVAQLLLAGCAHPETLTPPRTAAPTARPAPCFVVHEGRDIREPDAKKTLAELVENLRLSPADEALRTPKSLDDVRAILRRDLVYFYPEAAAFARGLGTVDGKMAEAQLELLLGDAMLVASQVLTNQEAQVGAHLRIARANLAGLAGEGASTERSRMLFGLVRAVEEGNKIADALGVIAPTHVARGAELVRELRQEAPKDPRTALLSAEYHRMRGEWNEVDVDLKSADIPERASALCYLKAMEQLERFRNPRAATTALRDCLRDHPRLVRAQAALVLVATGLEGGARELERLKKMDQDHYLILLLEPTLAADREIVHVMTRAEAPRAEP